MPKIISVDWEALKWINDNYNLKIFMDINDPRCQYLTARLGCEVLDANSPLEENGLVINADLNNNTVLSRKGQVIYNFKHRFGQGILAEAKLYLMNFKTLDND